MKSLLILLKSRFYLRVFVIAACSNESKALSVLTMMRIAKEWRKN